MNSCPLRGHLRQRGPAFPSTLDSFCATLWTAVTGRVPDVVTLSIYLLCGSPFGTFSNSLGAVSGVSDVFSDVCIRPRRFPVRPALGHHPLQLRELVLPRVALAGEPHGAPRREMGLAKPPTSSERLALRPLRFPYWEEPLGENPVCSPY